jgi:hypothetical protein
MTKDKRLAELPQISPAAVVALERVGCLSCSDLVGADFERIAFVLDDYNEATRLVREARRACGIGIGATRESGDPAPPGPLTGAVGTRMPRTTSRGAAPPAPARSYGGESMDLNSALGMLALGLNTNGGLDREGLKRRLMAMLVMLDRDASEVELLAASLLDPVECGTLQEADVQQQFGKTIAALVDDCLQLRAIPVLPSGRLPRAYLDRSRAAPREARRVCAAHLTALASAGGCEDDRYMRLHLDALRAGDDEEMVNAAAQAVEGRGPQTAPGHRRAA